METKSYLNSVEDFFEDVLSPYRAFVNILYHCNEGGRQTDPAAAEVGVVLNALNTLAGCRMDSFAAELKKEVGELAIHQSCDRSMVMRVSHISSQKGQGIAREGYGSTPVGIGLVS